MSKIMISCRNLRITFGTLAVIDEIRFDVKKARFASYSGQMVPGNLVPLASLRAYYVQPTETSQ